VYVALKLFEKPHHVELIDCWFQSHGKVKLYFHAVSALLQFDHLSLYVFIVLC